MNSPTVSWLLMIYVFVEAVSALCQLIFKKKKRFITHDSEKNSIRES